MLKRLQAVDTFKECNTEDEVFGKVSNLIAENGTLKARIAELEKAEKELAEFKDKLKKAEKETDDKFIDDAVKDGRIPENMRTVYADMMTKDRENAYKVINSLFKPNTKKVEDFIKDGQNPTKKESTWDKMIKEYAKNLSK